MSAQGRLSADSCIPGRAAFGRLRSFATGYNPPKADLRQHIWQYAFLTSLS